MTLSVHSPHQHSVRGRAPTLDRYVILTAANLPLAFRAIERIAQALLPSGARDQPFLIRLPSVESALMENDSTLSIAAGATGATGETILTALLTEHLAVTAGGGGSGPSGTPAVPPSAIDAISEDTYSKALRHARFTAFVMAGAVHDTSTSTGRRSLILEGFSSGAGICSRMLVTGSEKLARRHAALGRLNDCREDLPSYFGYLHVVDPVLNTVPPLLKEWKWNGLDGQDLVLMTQFLNFAFADMDWFNGANGINALVARRRNQKEAVSYTDPYDFYSTVQSIEDLSDFGHRCFCGLGAADTLTSPTLGFTMKTWCEFYLAHIKLAFGLASLEEQVAWLEDAAIQFLIWFGLAAASLRRFIYGSNLDTATLGALTSSDCDPAQHLREKQVSLQTYNEGRNLFSWMQNSASKRPPSTVVLPLLSANRQMIKEYVPRVQAPGRPLTATLQSKQPQPPGSMTHLWTWLAEGVELLFGSRVWLIGQICTDFGISDWRVYCWSVLVSTKQGGAKLAVCGQRNDPNHRGLQAVSHQPPAGLDLSDKATRAKYSRDATDAEKKRLPKPPVGGKGVGGGGGGGGGGGRGRGKGKGRGIAKRGRGRSFRGPA